MRVFGQLRKCTVIQDKDVVLVVPWYSITLWPGGQEERNLVTSQRLQHFAKYCEICFFFPFPSSAGLPDSSGRTPPAPPVGTA